MKDKIILVLEDEIPLLNVIKKKLSLHGYTVIGARSVEQGMEYLREVDKVSAIWLDHYLLGEDTGLDFVIKLKDEESKWKDMPIFMVSNTATPDKIQAYINLGVNKCYTKAENRLDAIIKEVNKVLN